MNINQTNQTTADELILQLNTLAQSLNNMVSIYKEEHKAYKRRQKLSIQKMKLKYEYSKLLKDRHHQEQIIAMAENKISKLKKYQIVKKFRLKQQVKIAENTIDGIKEELFDVEQKRRQIVSDISAIAIAHEFSSNPETLSIRYRSIIEAFYNPKLREYNSLTGENLPELNSQEFKTIAPISLQNNTQHKIPTNTGEADEFSN